MISRAIDLLQISIPLGFDSFTVAAFNAIRRWGLDLRSAAFERLLKFLLYEAPELEQTPGLAGSSFWAIPANLKQEALAFLANTIPKAGTWTIDADAPDSGYIRRWNAEDTDTTSPDPDGLSDDKLINRRISTVLLSLPFDMLKAVLEHPFLFPHEMRKRRFDLAAGVVREREKRRKGGDGEGDEERREEESVVATYGHGDCGVEVVRRRKGSGGRVLWKVGRSGGGQKKE